MNSISAVMNIGVPGAGGTTKRADPADRRQANGCCRAVAYSLAEPDGSLTRPSIAQPATVSAAGRKSSGPCSVG